jgi:hypothetical protein
VNVEILRSIKTRLERSTTLIEVDRLILFLFNERNISFVNSVKYLTLHKTLIRSVMIYACVAWEIAAETHLLKLQRLQNKVLRTIGNHPRCTSVRDMQVGFPNSVRL